jgi:Leucine-rich repeat (LRR) protein
MGACVSSPGGSERAYKTGVAGGKREKAWRATGLVGLRDAGLKALPAKLAAIAADVRAIDATNNRLESLPDFLAACGGLTRLLLERNRLTVAAISCALQLGALRVLVLDGNLLEGALPSLGGLVRLERLSAAGNRLTALPASLPPALRSLCVSRNALQALPEQLGAACPLLEELEAADNDLRALPDSLSRCGRLCALALDRNAALAVLPAGLLSGCAALHTLSLHGCAISAEGLAATPGYAAYEGRRRKKYDKAIGGGALLSGGLDEGITRRLAVQ